MGFFTNINRDIEYLDDVQDLKSAAINKNYAFTYHDKLYTITIIDGEKLQRHTPLCSLCVFNNTYDRKICNHLCCYRERSDNTEVYFKEI